MKVRVQQLPTMPGGLKGESGQTIVEYSFIVALISLPAIGVLLTLGIRVNDPFQVLVDTLAGIIS